MIELPRSPGSIFRVNVKTDAERSTLTKYDEATGAYQVLIKAHPDKGKANAELLRYLRREHGLSCEIISGARSRKKLLRVL